ncbi:MAG: restriction endonuclease subunit S [Lachnospiraceae bacterium]|nr:restriction endonuclease subunit S [Lachnospiraceae bacterium]
MNMMFVEDCCEILDSMRVPITAADREEGEYPYYGANGIQDHVADYIFDDELVLLAEDGGNFGSKERPIAYRVSGKCWVNNHAHVLKPKEGLNVDYLCYSLMFYNVDGMVNGATRQKLTQTAMRKMQIPSRTLEEQVLIVDELNRIVKIKEQRQQELQLLDDLIKARFVEMFGDPIQNPKGWDLPLIEDVVANEKNALKAGPFGSALKKEYYVKSGYKIYGQEQVISGDHTFGDYYIDEKRYKSLENCAVKAGDVLISLVGTYGKLLIIPEDFEPGIINPRLMKITFDKEKVNPYYFKFFFQSESLKRALSENTHGGTMDILNLGIVRKIAMPLPPLELQNEFVSFVNQVDKSKVAVQKSLDETQQLFDSLMQEYFG